MERKAEEMSWADIKAMVAEFAIDRKEWRKEWDIGMQEWRKEWNIGMQELRESQKETDRKLKELSINIDSVSNSQKETGKQIKELSKNIGGISNSNGKVAESYFINSLERNLEFAGIRFDSLRSNRTLAVRMPDGSSQTKEGEIDITMLNGNCIALIEIKYKAKDTDIENLVTTKVENFRKSCPEYKDFAIYLGLGSFSFDDYVVNKARELGVAILKQVGETVECETAWIKAY
jgi:hypothetical protein